MYSFKNDYSEGAHPRIIAAITSTNMEQSEGYGDDEYTKKAKTLIAKTIGIDHLDIHFFVGGTQTNLTAISAFLRPHEAVIAATTGHVCVHETGAIEATGHKIIAMPGLNGKLTVQDIKAALSHHTDEHMVKPKLVYISNSTEIGSIYLKEELINLYHFCQENDLLLFLDGARLGSALTSSANDISLNDLATYTDAFYIGGTKNGALFGEALIISNLTLGKEFRFHIKQKGALLAKGRLLALQFIELFKDHLFFDLAQHANNMASILRSGIADAGYGFLSDAPSNQVFPIFPETIVASLEQQYAFYRWSETESGVAIRLITSWATTEEKVEGFIETLKSLT